MKSQKSVRWAFTAVSVAVLSACGGGSDSSPATDTSAVPLTVPKVATCATGDVPETALQGQVPAAVRATGFKGFNCNLTLLGQYQGEGGNWSAATFTDPAGRTCAYHATGFPTFTDPRTGVVTPVAGRAHPGVPVIDITDPAKPVRTTSLTTTAMLDPWESLRVNASRQLLVGDNGANAFGGPEIDIYDLSGDCRSPQLLASMPIGTGADGAAPLPTTPIGHEGGMAPDGLTYYFTDIRNGRYLAIDISNTTKPKLVAAFDVRAAGLPGGVHGLSVSKDGTRMYGVASGPGGAVDTAPTPTNGFYVFDTSEVQARKPNAQIKMISKVGFADGATAQHTIPIKVAGKPYIVMVDEGGSAGLLSPTSIQTSCAAGLSPFPMARIYDVSDETKPQPVSKLMLETHDVKNCSQTAADSTGLSLFTYGSHYCSVDNRENATALACSYFNSGIRVFDIRDPVRPKEIAYYNPAAATAVAGSAHAMFGQWKAGGPDWCASRLDFDFAKKQLTTMCQDNGLLVMKFAPQTWPFTESTASRDQS